MDIFDLFYMVNDKSIALMVHDARRATVRDCNSISADVVEDTIEHY